jgi:hypothetical protein
MPAQKSPRQGAAARGQPLRQCAASHTATKGELISVFF